MSRTYRKDKKGNEYRDKDGRNRKPARSCLNHGGCDWCDGDRLQELEAGDYAKASDGTWWVRVPNGVWARIKPKTHKIVEHADGTITVSPSILITQTVDGKTKQVWHGYLTKGIWKEC